MNKPNEGPARPGEKISDEVREELLSRLKTYPEDKKNARPARAVLEEMLKRPPADVKP